MRKLHALAALALIPLSLALGQSLFSAMEVQAQNTTCANRPLGDSTNACANTRFVGAAASAISGLTPIGAAGGGLSGTYPNPSIATGGGVPTNVRSAYTSVSSMALSDCGKTVALGGSAFYNFIVATATTYNSVCEVIITNEDSVCPSGGAATCRGKSLSINGYTPFILWPGQTFNLLRQSNAWQFTQPGRWVLEATPQFNVNHASGLSPLATTPASDCLGTGSGACNLIQNAILVLESYIDCNNYFPVIKNVAETFTENNATHTHGLVGAHVFSLTGDTTTPSNVTWQVSGSGNTAYQGRDTGMAIITGFKFVSTGTNNNFIQCGQLGICDFGSIEFGANPAGYDINLTPGGAANWFGGSLSITGDMAGFVLTGGEGHLLIDGATISIPNARTWTNFLQISGPAVVSFTSVTFTGAGATSSTGRQWLIDRWQNINVTGTTIPGTVGLYNCQPFTAVFVAGTNAVYTAHTCNGLYPLSLELELWGSGAGGAGNGATPTAASPGGLTCWNNTSPACTTPQFSASGGAAGAIGALTGVGAAGGTGITCDINDEGGRGGPGEATGNRAGGGGGNSTLGGGAPAGILVAVSGISAAAFSASGGSGASAGAAPVGSGGGGGAGGHCKKMIVNPAPSAAFYTISVGGPGGIGAAGVKGGDGATGRIQYIERW